MANKRNYQKELDAKIAGLHGEVPTLLLHSCCAPCSSYVLEYLSQYFSITLFYYNPNIYPPTEYEHRVEEQQRLIHSLPAVHPISFCPGPYDSDRFYELTPIMFISVDFPEPDGPIIATYSPSETSREISLSTGTASLPCK